MTRSRLVVAVGVSGHVNVLALLQRDKLKGNSRRVDDSPRVLSATVTGPINMSHVNTQRGPENKRLGSRSFGWNRADRPTRSGLEHATRESGTENSRSNLCAHASRKA